MASVMLGACFIALSALTVLTVSRRRWLSANESDIWLKLTVGMCFIDMYVLLHLLDQAGLAGLITYLSNEMLWMNLTTVSLISGILFLLAGLAEWIPDLVSTIPRLRRSRKLAELVSSIQQTCSWNVSERKVIAEVMRQVYQTLEPQTLLYMKWDEGRNLLSPVLQFPDDIIANETPTLLIEEDDWLGDAILSGQPVYAVVGEVGATPDIESHFAVNPGDPVVVLPVTANGVRIGVTVMALTRESELEREDMSLLQVGMNSLASSLVSSCVQRTSMRMATLKDTHSRLLRVAASSEGLAELLTDGVELFHRFLSFDMLSVSVLDENNVSMKRYSVMESGNRISEKGLSLPLHGTVVERVVQTGKVDTAKEMTGIAYSDDQWLSRCGFCSRLSVPIFDDGRVIAVVSYASVSETKYSESEISDAGLVSDILTIAIKNSQIRQKLRVHSRQIRDSWRLLSELVADGDTERFFDEFVRQVASNMPVTSCRLSLYDRDRNTLRSISEHSHRISDRTKGRFGCELQLERLPQHLSVVRSGSPLMVNQTDPNGRMSDDEAASGFSHEIRSAMLVPLYVGGSIRGIMSLGEARDWERRSFSSDDMSLAQMQATQASLAIAVSEIMSPRKTRTPVRDLSESEQFKHETLSLVMKRMAGPLSSIMGASELLERKLSNVEGPMMDCVRTIRRNTGKVTKAMESFRQFSDTVS